MISLDGISGGKWDPSHHGSGLTLSFRRRNGVGGAMRKGDLCVSFLESKAGLNAILSKAFGFSGEHCDTVVRNFMFKKYTALTRD